jgi:hypothetical protein
LRRSRLRVEAISDHDVVRNALGRDMKMSATELIIQLLKVAIGLAFGAYFVWWSLEVLYRLPPH